MKIKLIALDLDGTTLRRDRTLSDRNRNALFAAMEQGVLVVPTTGRTYEKIPDCMRTLPGVRYVICSNGARAYDKLTGESIYTNLMPYEAVCTALEAAKPFDCFIEVYLDGKPYCRAAQFKSIEKYPRVPLCDYEATSAPSMVHSLRALIKKIGIGPEKVNLWPNCQRDYDVLWRQLAGEPAITVTTSGVGNIEVNAAGCDKGDGLVHLCGHLGIDSKQVMAAGDNLNDYAMLKFAGESVAMGNAIEGLKRVAKYIAPTNDEDGVAEMIERLVLDA